MPQFLLKIHDEYVMYLNQTIEDKNDQDFDKMTNLINKAIEKLPKKCKEIFHNKAYMCISITS